MHLLHWRAWTVKDYLPLGFWGLWEKAIVFLFSKCWVVLEQIHQLDQATGSNKWIHLPLSLYKQHTLYICMSVFSCHPKTNKHLWHHSPGPPSLLYLTVKWQPLGPPSNVFPNLSFKDYFITFWRDLTGDGANSLCTESPKLLAVITDVQVLHLSLL